MLGRAQQDEILKGEAQVAAGCAIGLDETGACPGTHPMRLHAEQCCELPGRVSPHVG
jgi:hypothetical protein